MWTPRMASPTVNKTPLTYLLSPPAGQTSSSTTNVPLLRTVIPVAHHPRPSQKSSTATHVSQVSPPLLRDRTRSNHSTTPSKPKILHFAGRLTNHKLTHPCLQPDHRVAALATVTHLHTSSRNHLVQYQTQPLSSTGMSSVVVRKRRPRSSRVLRNQKICSASLLPTPYAPSKTVPSAMARLRRTTLRCN